MKEKNEKESKFHPTTYYPPFLEGFNLKERKTSVSDINLEVITSEALKLIKKVSQKGETSSDTVARVVENYLMLIGLGKVYQLLFYDALKNQTTSRLESMKKEFISRVNGNNKHLVGEIDDLISKEIRPLQYERFIHLPDKQPKPVVPMVSEKQLLPALKTITYDDILEKLIQENVFTLSDLPQLEPSTEFGFLASTVYKATMSLVEAEFKALLDTEQLKFYPQSLDDLYSRIKRMGTFLLDEKK